MSTLERFAYVQFCDDVRTEIGNKTSLMGLYSGELLVESAPVALPRLCAVVTCVTSVDQLFSKLSVRLSVGNDTLVEVEVPSDHLESIVQNTMARATPEYPVRKIAVSATLQISPYVIAGASVLSAVAITDGEEILAGRLRINVMQAQPAESAPPQVS